MYRARDTKLNRIVALKILPDAFVNDPDRLARFKREAQVLASLNHPNIAAIYGFEKSNGIQALVLELVEGPTLAERLAQGAGLRAQGLPLDEALAIARQIAEALEAAHERGIIHRDLKPANIKLRPDGMVKVLDFGLAKALEPISSSGVEATVSPTITSPAMTGMGVILGTAAYMSLEQAKGRAADKRSDIWGFGCVLYEMPTGKRAFDAEDVSDTLASVLKSEPDLKALPADLAPAIRTLIQRCLAKDRRHRAGDISVAQFVLTEAPSLAASNAAGFQEHDPTSVQRQVETAVATARREMIWRRMLPVTAAVIVLAATVGGVGGWIVNRSPSKPPVARFSLTLPDGQQFSNTGRHLVAISPDGTQLVYVANNRLYLRSVSDLEARAIPGTEIKEGILDPVFSPDGNSLAFFQPRVENRADANGTLKRIAVSGGVAVTICPAEGVFGMTWDASGIVFGQRRGIFRCPSGGGSPEQLAMVKADELAHGPQILPGGQALLFTVAKAGDGVERWDKAKVVVQSLTSGARKTLINGGSDARYLVTGHLLYALRGTVFAVPFDLTRQEIAGGPVAVVEGVRRALNATTGVAHLDTSGTGSLVYIPGPSETTITERAIALADRAGAVTRLAPPAGPFVHTRASRDGARIAVDGDDGKEAIVWIYELAGTSAMRRLTFGGKNRFPIWSPDGQRVAFQSDREGDLAIFTQRADGSGSVERLTKPEQGAAHVPESWSPDGRYISFSLVKDSTFSLWTLSVEDKKSAPFGGVQSNEPIGSCFLPTADGSRTTRFRRVSRSDSPSSGVFIQPFPATGARYQVPKLQSYFHPVWSSDGTELFYVPLAVSGRLAAVRVSTQSGVTFGSPQSLPARVTSFRPSYMTRAFDILPDGKFIGLVSGPEDDASSPPHRRI